MKKDFISVVYDRKKRVASTGVGNVELRIYLGREEIRYVVIKKCNLLEWRSFKKSVELKSEIATYRSVVERMIKDEVELTVANFNSYISPKKTSKENLEKQKKMASPTGFIDFMIECIEKEKLSKATYTRKYVTIDAMKRFGKLNRFSDIIAENIKDFDDFLRSECSRSLATIHNYHKNLKMYTRLAYQLGYIITDPYISPLCHFERGKYKERHPLTEEELVLIRSLALPKKEERVRDLFIFCAYTGLAFIDSQMFDFHTMTEKCNDFIYIDGKRVKTGNTYFTPILPPAMEILEKYDYKLPHITNQKANDYLHLIESRCCFNKPLTTHVARHSFATLCLSYDIPIENVARMMGHSDIKTTQVYAKILKSTIERHSEVLASKIK